MSRRFRTTFALALLLGSLFAVANASPATAKAPIKIAVEAPLTGSQSSNGLDMLRGVQLAVRQANRRGRGARPADQDRPGRRQGRPARMAKRVARRVIRKNVAAVIGPYNSSVGIVNLPIYLRNRVVPVHLTSSDDTSGRGHHDPAEEQPDRADRGEPTSARRAPRRSRCWSTTRRTARSRSGWPTACRARLAAAGVDRDPHLDQGAGRQRAGRLLRVQGRRGARDRCRI